MAFDVPDQPLLAYEHIRTAEACTVRPQRSLDGEVPVPESVKVMFIIGAQKGGTTWLWSALKGHLSFKFGQRYRGDTGKKELHHFDQWPLPPFDEWRDMFKLNKRLPPQDKVLVDATPSYLYTAAAPAAIKQLVPHARFVIMLRDPVSRALSAHRKHERRSTFENCNAKKMGWPWVRFPGDRCEPTFAEAVDKIVQGNQTCLFQAASNATWYDCNKCRHKGADTEQCSLRLDDPAQRYECEHTTGILDPVLPGLYAAQLAWWLQFFPPERFLVLPSVKTKKTRSAVQLANAVRRHAGLNDVPPFQRWMLRGIWDNVQSNSLAKEPATHEEVAVLPRLRQFFAKPQADLQGLLRHHDLDAYTRDLDCFLHPK